MVTPQPGMPFYKRLMCQLTVSTASYRSAYIIVAARQKGNEDEGGAVQTDVVVFFNDREPVYM